MAFCNATANGGVDIAKVAIQHVDYQVAMINPELDFNLVQLMYEFRDVMIIKPCGDGGLIQDADVIFARPE